MSINESAATPGKLGFGAIFRAAFGSVFGQFWMFLKAAILPFVLSLAIGGLGFLILVSLPELSLPIQILGLVPFAILGVAFCRLVLFGRQAGAIPRPLFGRRTLVFFGYTLLFLVIFMLPMILASVVFLGSTVLSMGSDLESANLESFTQLGLLVPLIFVFYPFYLYLVTRISLVFPAVAADQKLGLGGSWRLTRGNGLKLFLVLVVITILMLICISLAMTVLNGIVMALFGGFGSLPVDPNQIDWATIALAAAPMGILGLVVEFVGFALIIAAIAKAYAHLSGWGSPREEILERFE